MKVYIRRLLVISLSMLLTIGTNAFAQRNSRTSSRTHINTSKLLETENIDVVYISPAMLQFVPKASLQIDGTDALKGIMDGISSIHIYSSSERNAIKTLRNTFAPILELRHSDLEQLMYIKDDEGMINFIGQLEGDIAHELYMIVSEEDEYSVINFSGSFPRQQLEEALSQESLKQKKAKK